MSQVRRNPGRAPSMTIAACVSAILIAVSQAAMVPAASSQSCDQNQLSAAIDQAGEKLRQLTQETQPTLQAKLLRLKEVKGWSSQDYEEKGYAALADERTAKLDVAANDLLAHLDRLSNDSAGAAPDCARIGEIESVSLELQATVRAKSKYVLARLDQLIGEPSRPPDPTKPAIAAVTPQPGAPPAQKTPPAPPAPSKPDNRWATQTKSLPIPPQQLPSTPPVIVPPPDVAPAPTSQPETEGYTIDEIVDASRGVFGKVSANLARLLEHAFAKSGRPSGYILGDETGGAFIAGLRYGSGRLYLRSGGSMPVYWHGPSLGADVGAQGATTLFLVYKVRQPEDVFSSFTGIEGSAFVVGGLGLTYMSNGRIDMAPIRSGIGLRLGANIGYMRFTSKPTWNPF